MKWPELCGVILLLASAAQPLCAQNPDVAESDALRAESVTLTSQLGDERFSIRERATNRLIQIGLPARVALQQGRTHPDREIRFRCERILSIIEEVDFQRRLAAFAAGRDDDQFPLPGWRQYRKVFGEDGEARALFVEMQKAEPDVMEAIENGPEGIGRAVDMRCFQLQQSQRVSRQPLSLGTISALLFAAGDKQVQLNFQASSALCSFCYQAALNDGMNEPAKEQILRSLLGDWIERGDGWTAYQTLALAMRYELKEGLVPAERVLQNPGNQPYIRQNGILAIAKLGDNSHIKLLEALLDDNARCATQRNNNVNYETQLRDVALAAILIMNKQDPKQFGFDRIQENPSTVFITGSVGFENDEKRNQAFAKWQQFQATQKQESRDTNEPETE